MEEDLARAAENGDLETVKNLLEEELSPNFIKECSIDSEERFLLKYVVELDQFEMLQLLLDHGGRKYINYKYPLTSFRKEETLLHVAVRCGNLKIIKLLLDYEAEIDARDEDGETPLFEAVYINTGDYEQDKIRYNEVVDLLLEYGANINAVNNYGSTPILAASVMGNMNNNCTEKLFKMGADVNIADKIGKNMLMLCFRTPEDEFRKPLDLIKRSTSETIKAQDVDGRTPLMHAIINAGKNYNAENAGVIKFIKELVKAGADIDIKDKSGHDALSYAISINNIEIVQILIDHGAKLENADAQDDKGRTLLMRAVINVIDDYAIEGTKTMEFIEKLLIVGANINIRDNNGYDALLHAISKNNMLIARFLINHGARLENVNIRDNEGKTPLMRAVIKAVEKPYAEEAEAIGNIERLLQAGADINTVDNNGYSVLLHAMSGNNNIRIVQFLINYGARLDFNNENINRALSNAILTLNPKIIESLKRNLIFDTIFDRIDFDNQENKQRLFNGLTANGMHININNISNANKNTLKKIINIAITNFGQKTILPFWNINTPMKSFIDFGMSITKIDLSEEEQKALKNIITKFDKVVIKENQQEIKSSVNELFKLCKTNQNVYDIVESVINKDVIYMNNKGSLTKLLNSYGFNTKLFDMQMQVNEIFRRSDIANRINNNEKSVINKSFELIYRIMFDKDFDILSQNLDINNACLAYQREKTEENEQNLINTIINNTNNEEKKSLVEYLINIKYFKINNNDVNITALINIATYSDLGKCLFLKLKQELQLNNVANANNALNNNQQQL